MEHNWQLQVINVSWVGQSTRKAGNDDIAVFDWRKTTPMWVDDGVHQMLYLQANQNHNVTKSERCSLSWGERGEGEDGQLYQPEWGKVSREYFMGCSLWVRRTKIGFVIAWECGGKMNCCIDLFSAAMRPKIDSSELSPATQPSHKRPRWEGHKPTN